jgi:Fur family peroxide stress response transcriptional regulator
LEYISLLQQYNLKVTPQRLEIVNILYKEGHINIDALYKLLQEKFPTLSLATIYKNINKMCENLFVSEVKIPNQKAVYELTKEEHSHIICSQCNEIKDIEIDIGRLITKAEDISNYKIEQSSLIFSGLCPKCNL